MSTYSTIDARIEYNTHEDYQNALNVIEPWLDEDGIKVNEDTNRITIQGYYRNLGRFITRPDDPDLLDGSDEHIVVETCTDGMFHGYVYDNGFSEDYNLDEWGENRPDEDEFESHAEWFENYTLWQSEVESAFYSIFRY
jgi:hypothetical protein